MTIRRNWDPATGAIIICDMWDAHHCGSAARRVAEMAPRTNTSIAIDWNDWTADEKAALSTTLADPGSCSCESVNVCGDGKPPYPWLRRTPLLDIAPDVAISDDGHEIFNLLDFRRIADVLVMGVHRNICVLGQAVRNPPARAHGEAGSVVVS